MSDIIQTLTKPITDLFSFTTTEGAVGTVDQIVSLENTNLDTNTNELYMQTFTNESLVKYQTDVYDSLVFINTVLLVLYVLCFICILGVMLKQYYTNIPRNTYLDLFVVSIIVIYPFVISALEIYLYNLWRFIYSSLVIGGYSIVRLFQRNTNVQIPT